MQNRWRHGTSGVASLNHWLIAQNPCGVKKISWTISLPRFRFIILLDLSPFLLRLLESLVEFQTQVFSVLEIDGDCGDVRTGKCRLKKLPVLGIVLYFFT